MRKQKALFHLTKFSVDLDGLWYAVQTCRSEEPHAQCIMSNYYPKERTLGVFSLTKSLALVCIFDIYRTISFKLVMMIDTTKLCIVISV